MTKGFVESVEIREALQHYYEGFSLPDAGFDDELCEVMTVGHARETIERALVRFPSSFVSSEGHVRRALESPLSFDDVWCKAVTATLDALSQPQQDSAVHVATALTAWSDQINTRPAIAASDAVLFTRGRYSFELAFSDRLGPDDEQFLRDQALDRSHTESVRTTLNAAFDLIDRYAPEYGPWVLRLLKRLIPLEGGLANSCQSGSSRLDAGACHMAFPCEPEALAEMLVHESTHQYYYLLTRAGRVEDGTDSDLYFSPAKQCGRPIYFILIAYHAFANVLLFSSRCLAAGYADPRDYLNRNVSELKGWMDTFESHLNQTNALTSIGTALWVPLSRAIHAPSTSMSRATASERTATVTHE